MANNSGINIKKSHKGLFTAKAKKAGMSVQEFAKHVKAHPENYSGATRKQANFARNAKTKFKHQMGGAANPYEDYMNQVLGINNPDVQIPNRMANTVPLGNTEQLSNPGTWSAPNRQNKKMKTDFNPAFKAINQAATIGTFIGDTLQDIKTGRQEHKDYLKSIQPRAYENYQANGLNNVPVYTQMGGDVNSIINKLVLSKLNQSKLQMGGKSILSRFGPHPYETIPTAEFGRDYDRINPDELALYKLNLQKFQIGGGRHYFPNNNRMVKNVWAVPGGWGKYNFGDDYVVQTGGQIPEGQGAGKWKNYLYPRNNQTGGTGPQFRFVPGSNPTAADSAAYKQQYQNALDDLAYRKQHPILTGFQDFFGSSDYSNYAKIKRGLTPGIVGYRQDDPRVTADIRQQENMANAYEDALPANMRKQYGGYLPQLRIKGSMKAYEDDCYQMGGPVTVRNGLMRKYVPSYTKYMAHGGLTAAKAREILHDGTVHGKKITERQRRYFGAVASGNTKYQQGGVAVDNNNISLDKKAASDITASLSPEQYYQSSAKLAYYKDKLNQQLKSKNPQAFTDYFKGLQGARGQGQKQGFDYVQNTPYDVALSPEEVKKTLGSDKDYQNYLESLKQVNAYNVKQGQQPLYGTGEQNADPSQLSYGRRFASLQMTPSFSSSITDPQDKHVRSYNRQYQYNPQTGSVDFTETGDLSQRPSGFSAPAASAQNSVTSRQYGGYQNGGYNVGDEVDLTEDEINDLIAQGYEFEDPEEKGDFSILY